MTEMITIEVSDSRAVAQLPAFRIQVSSNATTPPPPANARADHRRHARHHRHRGPVYTFAPGGR